MTFPTKTSNTLDLLLKNQPPLLKKCKPTLDFRDHNSIILSDIQNHPPLRKPIQQKIYNWKNKEIGQLRAYIGLATHMDTFIQRNTVQTPIKDPWRVFSGTISFFQTEYVPSKSMSKRFT